MCTVQHIGILCFLGTLLTKAGARHLRPCGIKSETQSGGYQELWHVWCCVGAVQCLGDTGHWTPAHSQSGLVPGRLLHAAAVLQSHAVCSAQCPRLQQHGGGRQEDQLEPGQTHVSRAVCLLCFSPNVVKIAVRFR